MFDEGNNTSEVELSVMGEDSDAGHPPQRLTEEAQPHPSRG